MDSRSAKEPPHAEHRGDSDDDPDGAAGDVETWQESKTDFQASSPPMSSLLFEDLEHVGILEERVSRSPSPQSSPSSYARGYGKAVYGRTSPSLSPPLSRDFVYAKTLDGGTSPSMSPAYFMPSPRLPGDIVHGKPLGQRTSPSLSPPQDSMYRKSFEGGASPPMPLQDSMYRRSFEGGASPLMPPQDSMYRKSFEGGASPPMPPRLSDESMYDRTDGSKTPPSMSPMPSMSPQLSDHSKLSPSMSPLPSMSPALSDHGRTSEARTLPHASPPPSQDVEMKDTGANGADKAEVQSLTSEALENKAIPQPESASDSKTGNDVKLKVDKSVRTAIPAFTQAVVSAAKTFSTKKSFLSRSPSAIYGSNYNYGSKLWLPNRSRQMRIIELILRIGGAVLSLIAFAVMAATTEKRSGAGSTFTMKFHDFQAYSYLVSLNVLSFLYGGWHLIQLGQPSSSRVTSSSFRSRLYIYICDQVLALLLLSASSSAATASQLSRHGVHNIWPPACSTWALWLFCSKADAAVVMSFFASFFAIASSVLSGYQLSGSFED